MRIISGKLKGRKLVDSSRMKDLRPTTDRNRQALFNILFSAKFLREINFELVDANVLDLCCGTGAVAFEAISRGAKNAFLVDKNFQHLDIAKQNAKILGIENQTKFLLSDARNLSIQDNKFDFIYIDPPYAEVVLPFIENLIEKNLILENSLIVVENDDAELIKNSSVKLNLKLLEQRKYANSYFTFLTKI